MPFTKSVLPVLPKPDHLVGSCHNRPLSAIEDKELRKKLRNRQSALAARERKKARMLELERNVAELQQANKTLEEENSKLRHTLNAILRSATTPSMGYGGNMNSAELRPLAPKLPGKPTNDTQVCGILPTTEETKENTRHVSLGYVSAQTLTNIAVPSMTEQANDISNEATNLTGTNSGDNYTTQDIAPIDYSINSDKVSERRKYLQNPNEIGANKKTIKVEEQGENIGINALGKRQHEILRCLSAGNFANQKSTGATVGMVTIKTEASDSTFQFENEGEACYAMQGPIQQNFHITSTSNDENNSVFAQALKRSAHAMLLSSKQYQPTYVNNSSNAIAGNVPIVKLQGKRKQALPSIDAVFNLPSKVSRISYSGDVIPESNGRILIQSDTPVLEKQSLCDTMATIVNCHTNVPPQTIFAMQEEQPLSLVKWSTQIGKSKRDPYLLQSDDVQLSSFAQSISRPNTHITEEQMAMIPSDLSAIIENFSSGATVDGDDMLAGLYDSSAGNSPLESVSSGDSGLGVEDDPLDWIPDSTFFDFH